MYLYLLTLGPVDVKLAPLCRLGRTFGASVFVPAGVPKFLVFVGTGAYAACVSRTISHCCHATDDLIKRCQAETCHIL